MKATTKNTKINNSFKKSTNSINNTLKNFKKKKKINVTPYQGVKNEYILGLAMDNLNKYQENILLKENNEENFNNINILNNYNNNGNDNIIYDDINSNILNNNNKLNYYSINKNNNFNNKNNSNMNSNNTTINNIMNKTHDNFHSNNNYYNNITNHYGGIKNFSAINTITNEKERINNNTINNFYYNDYFLKNDLFTNNNINGNNQYNNNNKFNNESIMTSNTIAKNNNFNYFKNENNIGINDLNDINSEKNYENKFNVFINKTFDIKNENSKQNKIVKNNKKIFDKKLIFVLNNLELQELINTFENNFIYFDDLFLLSKEDLLEMKIPIGPRNRIINFIEKYKNYAKSYDFDELSSFMIKYKSLLINTSNISDNFNFNVTPLTNNKYKSTMTTENNKNIDSPSSDFPGKGLNMSNFEEVESISPKNEEAKSVKNSIKPKNKNRINRNNVCNQNIIINDMNKLINITKSKDNEINININENEKNMNEKNNKKKGNKANDINKCNTSRIKDKYNKFIIFENNEENNSKIKNENNIFSNSLFNELSSNNNNINETNYSINNIDNIANEKKRNIYLNNNNNSLPLENNENNINKVLYNKKNSSGQNNIKNFMNIFSEIENYQMNYEKMKKENNNRNNKINNLLENRNRPNLQYLKMKIKNSKYYNADDLKNESVRDLQHELEKMNFQKENDNNQLNSIKYNPSIQNYIKAQSNKINYNPLIEEFNKHK